jgi:hypothetical protein
VKVGGRGDYRGDVPVGQRGFQIGISAINPTLLRHLRSQVRIDLADGQTHVPGLLETTQMWQTDRSNAHNQDGLQLCRSQFVNSQ